jgi:hypothetical protein
MAKLQGAALFDPESPANTIEIMNSSDEELEEGEGQEGGRARPSFAPLHLASVRGSAKGGFGVDQGEVGALGAHADFQSKAAKMAFFARDCTAVNDFMSVGGCKVAQDLTLLRAQGVTHVLNCAGSICDNYFEGQFQYMQLFLLDSANEDIASIMYSCFDFIEEARASDG